MNKTFSKRSLVSIVTLLASVITIYLIAYSVVVKPMKADLESTNNTIELFQAQVNKINGTNNGENSKEKVTASIPTSPQPDDILLQIEEFATTSNITVNLIESAVDEGNTESEKLPEGIGKTGYTIEATAIRLEDVNTFLSSFKNSKRLFTVGDITINKTENRISLLVTFFAYNNA